MIPRPLQFLFVAVLHVQLALSVTVYAPSTTATLCIGAAPCDGNVLTAFPSPTSIPGQTNIQLTQSPDNFQGVSVQGSFSGFSLELSVVNQLIGNDGPKINPIFLNLMSAITSRAGKIFVRVGGNSQEKAAVALGGLPNDTAIEKVEIGNTTTFTPVLLLSPSLVYAMGNISKLLPVDWFVGVPFNDTENPRLELAELALTHLGENLAGLQLANEPDLYHQNGIRTPDYTPDNFTADWSVVLQDYLNDKNAGASDNALGGVDFSNTSSLSGGNRGLFVGPSVCCADGGGWTPEQVFATGFLSLFQSDLGYISVEHYPTNNCNDTGPVDPNTLLDPLYLNHTFTIELSSPYLNTANISKGLNKPFIMFETNTASCGGFSGLSDSFAAALWSVDYALSMASLGFSNALWHVGGSNQYYNPFTPPAGNQTKFRQWTVGSTFYSTLVVAEALSSSFKSNSSSTSGEGPGVRVLDVSPTNTQYTPQYAIFDADGNPSRVVLMNFLSDDQTGTANFTAYISVGGNSTGQTATTPSSVSVKYLLAPTALDKWNITWAGQTYGGPFASDGRMTGQEQIYTYSCDTTNNVCAVPVPAPAIALVFLDNNVFQESQDGSQQAETMTFATSTTATGVANTATVAQAVLQTSNGNIGSSWTFFGSTSFGSSDTSSAMSSRLSQGGWGVLLGATLSSVIFAFFLLPL